MKRILLIAALALSALSVKAQTNIQYRITVDGVNTSWTFDGVGGNNKDKTRIAGIIYGYQVYTNSLSTNDVALALGPWLKRQHLVLVDDYTTQKQSKDNLVLLAKIQYLLTSGSDLLTSGDTNSLWSVAAKAP